MPTIEIHISKRIQRHLAAVRLMSYMVFPDDKKLRTAAEITFRTILADWYSGVFAEPEREVQDQVVRQSSKPGEELPQALANLAGVDDE